jgi:hypothetical protein
MKPLLFGIGQAVGPTFGAAQVASSDFCAAAECVCVWRRKQPKCGFQTVPAPHTLTITPTTHPPTINTHQSDVVAKYKAAAEIANKALAAVAEACKAGAKVVELCRLGDDLITKCAAGGGAGAKLCF